MNSQSAIPHFLLLDCAGQHREAFASFCDRVGWRLEVADAPASALERASAKSFDIVIADEALPGYPIHDLLRTLKREKPSQAVIVLSDGTSASQAVEIMKAGALDLIQKPVDFVFLEQSIRQTMNLIQQGIGEIKIYDHVTWESLSFSFTSAELASTKLPLVLAERLHRSGAIGLNTKLELTLAFQEALINSLDHGNLELESHWKEEVDENYVDRYSLMKRERLADPRYSRRRIEIETDFDGKRFRIMIRNEGKGFLSSSCMLEAKSRSDLRSHGRGLTLIYCSMDEVGFADDGKEITMIKKVTPP